MKLTNEKFNDNTKKQLQQNFLDLIKENVISDLKDEGLQLNYKDYENIEKTIIESFNQKVKDNNVKKITEVEDVTLDDIITIKENDDDYIEDLTESQTFEKLYKYITESQKPQEVKKVIKEQENKNNNKESKNNLKESTNRRSKIKMSIIDRKKRKQIKESLNRLEQKRRKKNLKEGDGHEGPIYGAFDDADKTFENQINVGFIGYSGQKFDENKAQQIINKVFDNLDQEREQGKQFKIVSGLTAYGIPLMVYKEQDKRGYHTVGVACQEAKSLDCWDVDEEYIEGENWGDESETFLSMLDRMVKIGGGKQSEQEYQKQQEMGIETEKYELESLIESVITEQDDDDDIMDDIFEKDNDTDDKKPKDKKEPKDDKPEPKKDEPKKDFPPKDTKEPKQKKEDKDLDKGKEDELLKKVKEVRPELKTQAKVKIGKPVPGINGFTFDVEDDKGKQVSSFVVIETGPKEEPKEEKPEDKISGKVEESNLMEQEIDTNMTVKEFLNKYPEQHKEIGDVYAEWKVEQSEDNNPDAATWKQFYDEPISNLKHDQRIMDYIKESINKNRKRRLKEQSLDDTVKKIAEEKTNETMDEIYNAVQEYISSSDLLGHQTQTQGEESTEDIENTKPESTGEEMSNETPPENNEVPNKQEQPSKEDVTEKTENEDVKSEENESKSEDVDLEGLDELFGENEEEEVKESQENDDYDIFGETEEATEDEDFDEIFENEDYLKESFVRLFDINPKKNQVEKVTSPKDYGPKGQERVSSIFDNKTKDYVGDQTMKFPTENPKQKQKEKSMEKLMTDLDKIF